MTTKCKILVDDRNYTSWKFNDIDSNSDIQKDENEELSKINPLELRLFTGDVIYYNGELIYSFVKNCPNLAGILLLEKTYGRTENKKRLLYKCIPHDKRLPYFLVPYDIKLNFNKNIINKYITFRVDHWTETDKHPYGIIQEVLGNVDDLEVFYEYQLYCRSLHDSMKEFVKKSKSLKNNDCNIQKILHNPNYKIENRKTEYICTIDSKNSTDLDDAFSVTSFGGNYKISIYITNVFFWMEQFDFWSSFSQRVATIYLPNYKRPLLPTILSNDLCSLIEKQDRFAFVMDLFIDENGAIMKDIDGNDRIEYKNALIEVNKNYFYEDPKMVAKDKNYQLLLSLTQKLDKTIIDSHDVVTYWMIQMNKYCGDYMVKNKIGIFRSTFFLHTQDKQKINNIEINNLSNETKRVISNWNHLSGQYMIYSEDANLKHEIMQISGYIHITSPIRRLVDLLNQLLLMNHKNMIHNISESAKDFLEKWMNKMEYINTSMRSIRKIQTDCEVMKRCFEDPDIMKNEYEGIVFDKITKNDGLHTYMVYLEKLKILSRITTHYDFSNYIKVKFKLFLFEEDYKVNKKIRLQIIE